MEAIKYYNGEKFGNEVPGRSQIVYRSVLEAVEWVLPALLRIFTASDRICVIEPRLPGQEDQAEIATEYINHIFYRDNSGFMVLHDLFKDALLERLGWVKVWFDTDSETISKSFTHISRDTYDALLDQDGVELVKESSYTEDLPLPPGGPPMPWPHGPAADAGADGSDGSAAGYDAEWRRSSGAARPAAGVDAAADDAGRWGHAGAAGAAADDVL